jgi:hypothetical protein
MKRAPMRVTAGMVDELIANAAARYDHNTREAQMYWNHRVAQRDDMLVLVEAHYNGDTHELLGVADTSLEGESIEELRKTLQQMLRALDLPPIPYPQG